MKPTLRSVIAFVLMAALTGTARADQAGTVLIRRGTSMQFETEQEIDPATANRDDDVPLRLVRPLVIDGTTVLPAGFEAHGKVTRRSKVIGCAVEPVQWKIDTMRMPNGSTVLVQEMFVPQSGVIPERFGSRDLETRGLKRVGKDVAEVPVDLFITVIAILCMPFGCITSPFLPQQGSGACAGPVPDFTFPAHTPVPVAFAKKYRYRL